MHISKKMCIFLSRRKSLQLESFVWQKFYQEIIIYENIANNEIDSGGILREHLFGSSRREKVLVLNEASNWKKCFNITYFSFLLMFPI